MSSFLEGKEGRGRTGVERFVFDGKGDPDAVLFLRVLEDRDHDLGPVVDREHDLVDAGLSIFSAPWMEREGEERG